MRRIMTLWIAVGLFGLFAAAQTAPAPKPIPKLTADVKAAVVARLADILTEKYVFPDTGKKMADLVRGNLQAGLYASLERPDEFAFRLTEDLLSVSHDKHLHVAYSPGASWLSWSKNVDEEQERLEKRRSRMDNYGFREVKVLPGNIGYLKFDYFSGNPDAFPVAVGALAFLSGADALVFDLRENGGGDPQMIQVITSYLFEGEPKHLNSFYYREGERTEQFWTLPYVPGKRRPDVPVYVLTSGRTFSGAEEFSYNLKNLKRATIVGETTGGGAHPVNREPINDEFWVSVPYARAVNPVSKTNWEGTGVEPDVKVPARPGPRHRPGPGAGKSRRGRERGPLQGLLPVAPGGPAGESQPAGPVGDGPAGVRWHLRAEADRARGRRPVLPAGGAPQGPAAAAGRRHVRPGERAHVPDPIPPGGRPGDRPGGPIRGRPPGPQPPHRMMKTPRHEGPPLALCLRALVAD